MVAFGPSKGLPGAVHSIRVYSFAFGSTLTAAVSDLLARLPGCAKSTLPFNGSRGWKESTITRCLTSVSITAKLSMNCSPKTRLAQPSEADYIGTCDAGRHQGPCPSTYLHKSE